MEIIDYDPKSDKKRSKEINNFAGWPGPTRAYNPRPEASPGRPETNTSFYIEQGTLIFEETMTQSRHFVLETLLFIIIEFNLLKKFFF